MRGPRGNLNLERTMKRTWSALAPWIHHGGGGFNRFAHSAGPFGWLLGRSVFGRLACSVLEGTRGPIWKQFTDDWLLERCCSVTWWSMKEKERKARDWRGNLVSKNFGYQFRSRFFSPRRVPQEICTNYHWIGRGNYGQFFLSFFYIVNFCVLFVRRTLGQSRNWLKTFIFPM